MRLSKIYSGAKTYRENAYLAGLSLDASDMPAATKQAKSSEEQRTTRADLGVQNVK